MKIFHFLTVVIIFILTIFLVLVIAGPKKGCPDPVKKCSDGYVPFCNDGEWICVKDVLKCREDKKPICDYDANYPDTGGQVPEPVCINGDWHCNFYGVDPSPTLDDNVFESCYIMGMSITASGTSTNGFMGAEDICSENDCSFFTYNTIGSVNYSPLGEENSSFVSGMRLAPYYKNIFKRFVDSDMTNIFYGGKHSGDQTTYENVNTLKKCEELCVRESSCKNQPDPTKCSCKSGGFGYVYNKDTGTCNVYTTSEQSGTGKHIRDPIQNPDE